LPRVLIGSLHYPFDAIGKSDFFGFAFGSTRVN